ncbi:MAG: hypothetical protein IKX10_00760 [Lachnospiraceae bacterium]|nr:hypothetical protein [Lachnospiraceae bacterium]
MTYELGEFLGLVSGLGLAFFITISLLKHSNDIGDSAGKLEDFGWLKIIYKRNGMTAQEYEKDVIITDKLQLADKKYDEAVVNADAETAAERNAQRMVIEKRKGRSGSMR